MFRKFLMGMFIVFVVYMFAEQPKTMTQVAVWTGDAIKHAFTWVGAIITRFTA